MKNNIIVQISEGLGNQLFMYAHAYSLSQKLRKELLIDNTSGYYKDKNLLRPHQKYMLNFFQINNNLAPSNYRYDNFTKNSMFSLDLEKNGKLTYTYIDKDLNLKYVDNNKKGTELDKDNFRKINAGLSTDSKNFKFNFDSLKSDNNYVLYVNNENINIDSITITNTQKKDGSYLNKNKYDIYGETKLG